MKIGYPCINTSLGCCANKTFRLASYSHARLVETIHMNLDALGQILKYNVEQGLLFFRISSCLVPFASHSIMDFDWIRFFKPKFQELGNFIKMHKIRISMHPDQFIVINSPNETIVANSIKELEYHAQVLDCLELDTTAKIQIHGGGAYGNKPEAMARFISIYTTLPSLVKRRLVLENDERIYSLQDCLAIHKQTSIPILFDVLHYECLNEGIPLEIGLAQALTTWAVTDGLGMVDYSSQAPGGKKGKHSQSLNTKHFEHFLRITESYDFDIMMEVKDKEKSALQALAIARSLGRIK